MNGLRQQINQTSPLVRQNQPGSPAFRAGTPAPPVRQAVFAPPTYRPQPVPKVLQTKANIQREPMSTNGRRTRTPIAPPVYRPMSVPRVLQAKNVSQQSAHDPTIGRPVAPPVYRPEAKKLIQPKIADTKPSRSGPQAPPVYRPQPTPRVLQRTPAQTSPIGARQQNSAMQSGLRSRTETNRPGLLQRAERANMAGSTASRFPQRLPISPRSAVIQRVTYNSVVYDPNTEEDQVKFRELAKSEMVKEGTWATGRSESIIEKIGKTDKDIKDAKALTIEEASYWKDYDKQINEDLKILTNIQIEIDKNVKVLETNLPKLKTDDVSALVTTAVDDIALAVALIPEKWNVSNLVGFSSAKIDIANYLKIEPWGLATALNTKEEELLKEQQDRLSKLVTQQPSALSVQVINPIQSQAKSKPTKKENSIAKEIKTIKADILKVTGLEDKAVRSLAKLILAKQTIEAEIRKSAAQQFGRGSSAHTSVKSTMKNKKLYLGEIETTGKLRSKGEKGRGVLWAKPWSQGVNTAFIQGGAESGAVYKLKTAVPDHLKTLLEQGKDVEFRAAVKDQMEKEYYPFWQGIDKRFTIYTDELTYLMKKGYRLHEFKKKDQSMQQLMVHPGQLAEVTRAYETR